MKALLESRNLWVRAAVILIACLALFSFAALLFHHHEGGEDHSCFVCRVVQQITGVSSLLLSFFVFFQIKRESFSFQETRTFYSYLVSSSLSGRAPPSAL